MKILRKVSAGYFFDSPCRIQNRTP